MSTEIEPVVGNWYRHLRKGQYFKVIAVDASEGVVEIQHFDGDLEEVGLDAWYDFDIELGEEPENWAGAMDVESPDDLDIGSSITDTTVEDWNEPFTEYPSSGESPLSADEWEETITNNHKESEDR